MQLVTESPGFRFVTLYRAEPASLSVTYTVSASKLLPLFEVLLLNAESVPTPTMAPTTATISRERTIRLALLAFRSDMSCSFPGLSPRFRARHARLRAPGPPLGDLLGR